MPIIVPDPPSSPIVVPLAAELAVNRRNTEWFIAWRPYDVVLIPKTKIKSGSGTRVVDGTPRASQRMRLIPQSETTQPFTTPDGLERVVTHVLLGKWSHSMEVGDHWRDTQDFYYEILYVNNTNGYGIKGLVECHGNR